MPWISITSGQTGTGSGSFTFQVAANSSNANLTGTIEVVDVAVTVTEGDTVGSAGSGSATIAGDGAHEAKYECTGSGPDRTCNTVYQNGSLTLTIGGVSHTIEWSGNTGDTNTGFANQLANQFNADPTSPVTASVSNNVITFISKLTGAASNYAMSWSSTNDTDFPAAFYAILSGSSLSGGQ